MKHIWKACKIFAYFLIATYLKIVVERRMIIIYEKDPTFSNQYFSMTFTDFQWLFLGKMSFSEFPDQHEISWLFNARLKFHDFSRLVWAMVVLFLQLFSLIGSFHLVRLIVFNTAELLKIPLIFHPNWSSNTVYLRTDKQTKGRTDGSVLRAAWFDLKNVDRQWRRTAWHWISSTDYDSSRARNVSGSHLPVSIKIHALTMKIWFKTALCTSI